MSSNRIVGWRPDGWKSAAKALGLYFLFQGAQGPRSSPETRIGRHWRSQVRAATALMARPRTESKAMASSRWRVLDLTLRRMEAEQPVPPETANDFLGVHSSTPDRAGCWWRSAASCRLPFTDLTSTHLVWSLIFADPGDSAAYPGMDRAGERPTWADARGAVVSSLWRGRGNRLDLLSVFMGGQP